MACLHPVTSRARRVTSLLPDHPRWPYATVQWRCDATRLPYDPGSRAGPCPAAVAPRPPVEVLRGCCGWRRPVPRRGPRRRAGRGAPLRGLGSRPFLPGFPRGRASSRLRPARGAARPRGEAAPGAGAGAGGRSAPLCRPRGWRAPSRRVTDSCRGPRPGGAPDAGGGRGRRPLIGWRECGKESGAGFTHPAALPEIAGGRLRARAWRLRERHPDAARPAREAQGPPCPQTRRGGRGPRRWQERPPAPAEPQTSRGARPSTAR